jgi:proteic killer suppression protein
MDVVLDRQAQRQLKRTPRQIIRKLRDWVVNITRRGIREVSRQPGFHDEPLSGKRQGQRSIRLSRQWRAIYWPSGSRVSIQTVTPHDYRVHGGAEVDALPFLNRLLGDTAVETAMNKTQEKDIIKVLCTAGKQNLAKRFARDRGYVVRAAEWNEYASNADDHLNRSLGELRNLQGDSKYGKLATKWEKDIKKVITEISQATTKYGGSDTPA